MSGYRLTRRAERDLAGIWDAIAHDKSQSTANRVIEEIRQDLRTLARNPEMAVLRDDLADEPLRVWPIYSYLIVYRAGPRPIEIIRVVHGARDLVRLFEKRR
nr:hypothetical protein [uncultured bacterium]